MPARSPALDCFLNTMRASIVDRAAEGGQAASVAERIFEALRIPADNASTETTRLPVCELLDGLVDALVRDVDARKQPTSAEPAFVAHARAVKALSPQLRWQRRLGAEALGEPFLGGHANATVIGQGGLEVREDVWVGISLLAPGIVYPEHHHPPEEVYVVLSPGQWQQEGGAWFEPGIGGLVHNRPGILHTMRSGAQPLLASWCLWVG